MYLDRQRFKDWRPNGTDQDAGIDVLFRPPTLPEVVGPQVGIGRLQRFDYGHKESRRFRLVCLGMKVEEPADHIYPIHRAAISMSMIAAIQDDLQLIPGRCEIFVAQRATPDSGRSIRDVGCRRSSLCRNGVAPRAGIRGQPKEAAPASFQPKLLHHLPRLHHLPQLGRVNLIGEFRRPHRFCFANASEEGASSFRPLGEGGNDGANVVIRSLDCRQECAQRRLLSNLAFALPSRLPTVQGCESALCKGWSPCILGMYAGQPLAPIRELQGDGNLTSIEVAVWAKDVRGNLPHEFTDAGGISRWI